MKPSTEQIKTANRIAQNNPSLIWDGKFGYYSTCHVSISVKWSFDNTVYNITINQDGTIN